MITPHKAMLIQARDALLSACGGRCNAEYNPCDYKEVADALTAAIDAPEPEPDAYLVYDKKSSSQYACLDEDLGDMDDCEVWPLYTHPPAARQPLSDKQISRMWSEAHNDTSDRMAFQVLARAIEAAVRAKP